MSLNFQHYKGDTFEEVDFDVKINTIPVDLTDAVIRMQLRKECGGVIELYLTSVDNDGITITNPPQGQFKINKQIIDCKSGNYYYDIEINFADGTIKSNWMKGMFNITCDITR